MSLFSVLSLLHHEAGRIDPLFSSAAGGGAFLVACENRLFEPETVGAGGAGFLSLQGLRALAVFDIADLVPLLIFCRVLG